MLRLDVTSLVWAFFRPEEKEDYMEVRKEDQRDPDEKVVEIENGSGTLKIIHSRYRQTVR